MNNKISKAQYCQISQEFKDAKRDHDEAFDALVEANGSEVVDDCLKCKGAGEIEDGTGDPAHNPTGDMLYSNCPNCDGEGYTE